MRIAVIGAGISGMTAAYLLCGEHELTVFEAGGTIGGHTHTIDVDLNGVVYPVDTGFIVFNLKTYPNFVKLLKRLGVPWKASDMSFSARSQATGLEYCPSSFKSLFAQKRNLFRPWFYRMILDVFRFRRESLHLLDDEGPGASLGSYLKGKGYSDGFIHCFITPMGAAIWSADPKRFQEFPAPYFARFFHRHGFLNVRGQPQWLVVQNGSRSYVEPLTRPYRERIRLNCPVGSVKRHPDFVEVKPRGEEPEKFDYVIIAAHSDQALSMLEDPSELEREVLSAIPYQENRTVLHTDISLLPRRRAAWASWNYVIPLREMDRVAVTYLMNQLQGLQAPVEFCVTLNSPEPIDPSRIIESMVYHHPVYTREGVEAQAFHEAVNGANRTYFCGAYWGYGFHEDGVDSALAVCRHFGKTL